MRTSSLSLSLSLSLTMACAVNPDRTNAGESESDGQGTQSESDSGSLSSDASESDDETLTDDESGSDTETESETGVDPESFDPQCGEWTSTLVQALSLDEVRLDGESLIATGGGALVQRDDGGAWSDYVDFSLDAPILAYDEIWGPPDDRWVVARQNLDAVIYHFDGASLTPHATFPDAVDPQAGSMVPRELVGRGPDDIWALAAPDCVCFFPPCTCLEISMLLHWDGQSWSPVPTPGQLLDIALTETGVWGVGQAGLVARYDGQSWSVDDLGGGALGHVWALDDDEIWAGGLDSRLEHRSGGLWTSTELPVPWRSVIALEGRAADQVWALDDNGGLWAYDGVAWTELTLLPDAGGLAIVGEGAALVVVGGDEQHIVWEVDTADGTSTLLHEREHIRIQSMIADDVDHMLLSSGSGRTSWSVTDGVWEPAYEQLSGWHFEVLLGPIDEAIGVRNLHINYPGAVWQLGESPMPLPDPIEQGDFHDVIEFDGQLWIGGQEEKSWGDFPVVFAYDGASWTDYTPPQVDDNDVFNHLTAAGGRLFAQLSESEGDRIVYLDLNDNWVSLPSPTQADEIAFVDIAATASDQLWATHSLGARATQLVMWDGAQWHDAASIWPQLGEQCCWHTLTHGYGRLWVLSRNNYQSEQLAYFDGNDWTIVDTPPRLHGWREQSRMAVGVDGLFIHDGIYMWRYAFCPA